MPKIEIRNSKIVFVSIRRPELRIAYFEHRDQITCQVVAYKRLKTKENYTTVTLESVEITHKEVI